MCGLIAENADSSAGYNSTHAGVFALCSHRAQKNHFLSFTILRLSLFSDGLNHNYHCLFFILLCKIAFNVADKIH